MFIKFTKKEDDKNFYLNVDKIVSVERVVLDNATRIESLPENVYLVKESLDEVLNFIHGIQYEQVEQNLEVERKQKWLEEIIKKLDKEREQQKKEALSSQLPPLPPKN